VGLGVDDDDCDAPRAACIGLPVGVDRLWWWWCLARAWAAADEADETEWE
jgi:hypothetical protein